MAHSSLATVYIGDNKNQSGSGYRTGKNLIVLHHMAGILTPVQCNNALRGRGGSIHYAIGNDGTIGYGVDENNVAWHAGNWPINQRSIGIEVSNSALGGEWPVSEAAYESVIKLITEIVKRNKMGKLVVGKNFGYHGMYAATACAGPTLIDRMQNIADAVNANQPSPTPTPTPKDKFLPAKGYWGPGDKDKKVGQIATFMRRNFPSYTSAKALGNYYGPYLKASILEFQKRTKMDKKDQDGCVGPKTLAKLRSYGFPY
jgi:hypothetical protein